MDPFVSVARFNEGFWVSGFPPPSYRSIILKGANNCIQERIGQCSRVGHGASLFAVGENSEGKYRTGIIKNNIAHFRVDAADGQCP